MSESVECRFVIKISVVITVVPSCQCSYNAQALFMLLFNAYIHPTIIVDPPLTTVKSLPKVTPTVISGFGN